MSVNCTANPNDVLCGNARSEAVSTTTSSFVSSLVSNIAIGGVEILVFLLLHTQFRAIYEPRSYMPLDPRRIVPHLRRNWLFVFWDIYNINPKTVWDKNGTDAYVFVRFLRMMLKILIPIWLISWVILLPIDAAGTKVEGKSGLDHLTFGNVAPGQQSRYWAHLVLVYVFNFWFYYNIQREMRKWVTIRQRHLIDPEHSRLAQANTVLITGISKSYLDEDRLATLFSHLPGGVKKIWLNRNLKEMVGYYDRQRHAVAKLESAQVNLVKQARKLRANEEKKQAKQGKKEGAQTRQHQPVEQGDTASPSPSLQTLQSLGADKSEYILADKLIPRSKRPTHRLPPRHLPFSLPLMGEQVDTIDWCRREIVETTALLEKSRQVLKDDIAKPGTDGETYPPLNSAFIYFNQQIAAHIASQILLHDQPYTMHETYTEMSPEEVIWSNLSLNPYEKNVRLLISWGITFGILLLWTFPTAFIGAMSNAAELCVRYTWMSWLCKAPSAAQGIFSGVIPPILLAVLNLLLPIVLRRLAQLEGIPRKMGLEISLMTRYTLFLVIHSFLVVTLASGLISALPQIANNPSSVATILATQLPQASTFFLTYVMLQATKSAGNLAQLVSLAMYIIKLILLGGSPRSVWKMKYSMRTPEWGQLFPDVTIIAIITTSYMVISPVINGLSVAAFFLLYMIYKYLLVWVIDQPAAEDTGGLFFPKAITHLFVGMYIQQVALCALFFLARDANGKASSVAQGALMVVLIVITVAFQCLIINSYNPLRHPLPLSLAYLSHGMPKEEGHEGSILEGEAAEYDPRQPDKSDDGGFPRGLPNEKIEGLPQEHTKEDVEMANINTNGYPQDKKTAAANTGNDPNATGDDVSDSNLATARLQAAGFSLGAPPAEESQTEFSPMPVIGEPTSVDHPEEGVNATDFAAQPDMDSLSPDTTASTLPPAERTESNREMIDSTREERDDTASMDTEPDIRNEDHKPRYEFEEDAFSHPAIKNAPRIVWLPVDELGLAEAEVHDNLSIGINSSTANAILNHKGKVKISGPPPGETVEQDD